MRTKKTDSKIYELLITKIKKACQGHDRFFGASRKALAGQTKVVAEQVAQCMKKSKLINGYVEIGFPGRFIRPLRKVGFKIQGDIIAVRFSDPSLADYMQVCIDFFQTYRRLDFPDHIPNISKLTITLHFPKLIFHLNRLTL